MSDVAIHVENLSKRYRIGASQGGAYRYKALRDVLTDAMYTPFRALRSVVMRSGRSSPNSHSANDNHIWALKSVSFEVKQGEVLGIIGRNGAGKTTLLKILSRITEPTEGYAGIHGRVGSLLEVGTGFHPELTGRENTYLNGAILGMRKAEIDCKFDEIVAFAEIEKFMDTPVKHYSSGMYVRLAFAVAAHLEPEILLVDEVLAVGDIAFQKKCLGKMGDVAKAGRTVLLVSHNMGAIRSLCDKAIWLDAGRLIKSGRVDNIVSAYEDRVKYSSDASSSSIVERDFDDIISSSFYVRRVEMMDSQGNHTNTFRYNEKVVLIVDIAGYPQTRAYNLEFRIHNQKGQFVGMGSSAFQGILLDQNTKRVRIEVGPIILTDGRYTISFSAVDSQGGIRYDNWINSCTFIVTDCTPFGFGHELREDLEGICVIQHSVREID